MDNNFLDKLKEINLMRALNKRLDPNNILNPGKVFEY